MPWIRKSLVKRWKEHFKKCQTIKQLKNGKAGGIDSIPHKSIKAMNNMCIDKLNNYLTKYWMTNIYLITGVKESVLNYPKKATNQSVATGKVLCCFPFLAKSYVTSFYKV